MDYTWRNRSRSQQVFYFCTLTPSSLDRVLMVDDESHKLEKNHGNPIKRSRVRAVSPFTRAPVVECSRLAALPTREIPRSAWEGIIVGLAAKFEPCTHSKFASGERRLYQLSTPDPFLR